MLVARIRRCGARSKHFWTIIARKHCSNTRKRRRRQLRHITSATSTIESALAADAEEVPAALPAGTMIAGRYRLAALLGAAEWG